MNNCLFREIVVCLSWQHSSMYQGIPSWGSLQRELTTVVEHCTPRTRSRVNGLMAQCRMEIAESMQFLRATAGSTGCEMAWLKSSLKGGHGDFLVACRVAPWAVDNGASCVITASADRTARVWKGTLQGELYLHKVFTQHAGCVNAVAPHPFTVGKVASVSGDGTLQVWSLDEGSSAPAAVTPAPIHYKRPDADGEGSVMSPMTPPPFRNPPNATGRDRDGSESFMFFSQRSTAEFTDSLSGSSDSNATTFSSEESDTMETAKDSLAETLQPASASAHANTQIADASSVLACAGDVVFTNTTELLTAAAWLPSGQDVLVAGKGGLVASIDV
jgi:WD40 repeat protein